MTETAETNTASPVVLDAVLDVRAASGLLDAFRARRGEPLTVDASAVGQVGALCLQVLLAAVEAWREDGNPFEIISPSDDFKAGLQRLGADAASLAS